MKFDAKNSVASVNSAAQKKAFSLVELLIVISILGIMAAIVLPTLQDHSKKAKEAAAKDNLRIMRTTIETYAARHNGIPPGFPFDDPANPPTLAAFGVQLFSEPKYLTDMPNNPINDLDTLIIQAEALPADPTDASGWIYCPTTKDMRLNAAGTDAEGVRYYDY